MIEIFILILMFFYIRKLAMLVPSIANLIYPKFKPYTTIEYTIHMTLVLLLVELHPEMKDRIEKIKELMYD
jgi:hypothetical protein